MATTEQFYTGDGNTTNYTFPFEYIAKDDVRVSLDGVDTDQYTYANATTIQMNAAPAVDVQVRIYRYTDVDDLKATFFSGSSIRAQDLNNNFLQNNFAVQEIQNYTWDNETDTIHGDETWVSSDTQIATTAAMDAQFWDQSADTIQSTENFEDTDDKLMTAAAIDDRIDHVITNDIGTDGTGITVTDDGDGTITLGLADNSIDFSKIKDVDIITETEQDAGSPSPADTNLFSALGAARRFDTIVFPSEVSSSGPWEIGKTWLQNDSEKTVRIWDGSAWVAVASGGAFTTLSKVVYVDSVNGDDNLEGHRISNPKRTIKAAIEQINAETDEVGDGSVVIVAPGVYQEVAPIDIEKKNVSIIGQALRSCIVHPTPATEENTLFRLNSGSYVANLTLTGVKASGTRGGNALDTDSTHGLPTNQGWNFAFFPNATIVKSPYIANCTNFSDSEIDNSDLDAFNPRGGLGGDTDSAPTGGGILIDGSAVSSSSPLRSMVCDSYTHVGLDGPGIFVTNNGYCQATSSYAFFTHYHIKALNGGQANLAASTSDFGRFALIADGRSSSAIFTASTTATASDGATTFTIGAPSAAGSWFGSATRPQSNMVVDIGGNTYSIISATANGSGWDVEISRPNPDNLSDNLGLNGSVASGSTAEFFLRSMIASSGHTMEYVGSGTNYSALPENGGVPVEANEIVELNDGKVWAATTNHQGKFTVGPTFNVDQVTGYVNIANGAIGIEKLIENLDLNSFTLSDSVGDVTIDDQMDMNTHKIVNVVDPTSAQDAATKNYVDTSSANTNYVAVAGDSMEGDLNMNSNNITNAAGLTMTGDITMNAQSDVRFADSDSSNWVAVQAPATVGTNYTLTLPTSVGNAGEALITDAGGNLSWSSSISTVVDQLIEGDTKVEAVDTGANGEIQFTTDGDRAMTIDSSQNVGIGIASPTTKLHISGTGQQDILIGSTNAGGVRLALDGDSNGDASGGDFAEIVHTTGGHLEIRARNPADDATMRFEVDAGEAMRIDSSGNVGIGTASPNNNLHVVGSAAFSGTASALSNDQLQIGFNSPEGFIKSKNSSGSPASNLGLYTTDTGGTTNKVIHLSYDGNVGIGTSSPDTQLHCTGDIKFGDAVTLSRNISTGLVTFTDATAEPYTQGIAFRTNDTSQPYRFQNGDGTSTYVTIDGSGNVGIGTTSPDYELTVADTDSYVIANLKSSTTEFCGIYFGDTDAAGRGTIVYDNSADAMTFRTNGSGEDMRIDSQGKLLTNRTVSDTSGEHPAVQINTISTGTAANSFATGIDFQTESTTRNRLAVTTNNNWIFYRDSGSNEALRIDSSGRLLVGTSSSSGSSDAQHALIQTYGNTSGNFQGGRINIGRAEYSANITNGEILGDIYFSDAQSGEYGRIECIADGTAGSGDYPGRLVFSTTADGASNPTERMRIANTGAIGLSGANYGTSGQVLTSNGSGSAPSWQDKATVSSEVNTTSGSSVEFTGLTNVSKIIINFNQVSATAASDIKVQLGNSTAYISTSYLSTSVSAGGGTAANATDSFVIDSGGAASNTSGQMTLCKIDSSTTWTSTHSVRVNSSNTRDGAGIVDTATANPVEKVKISIDSGTFDAGSVNIIYWT